MQQQSERRVSGVRRISIERVVEVCERGAQASAFRGRSVDISGRGMQLWANHLPELGAPLVLRFRERGQEIIAEGEVAWCNRAEDGGEFGVRFTALDSRSVQALKMLCQAGLDVASPSDDAEETVHDTDPAPPAAPLVKLHMAGLGEPMRAQIRGHGQSELEVSSQLEFLRLGRGVEVEEPSQGGQRRAASIAGVDVVVDSESRVPELIVSMRYADAALTPVVPVVEERPLRSFARARSQPGPARPPEPELSPGPDPELEVSRALGAERAAELELEAELEAGAAAESDRDAQLGADRVSRGLADHDSLSEDAEPDAEVPEQSGPSDVERLRERMDGVLSGVAAAARVAGEQALRFGGAASRGAHWLARRAHAAASQRTARPTAPKRRTTGVPPRSALRTNPLLRQTARPASVPAARGGRTPGARRPLARIAVLGSAFAAAVAAGALLAGGESAPSSEAPQAQPAAPAAAAAPAVVAPAPVPAEAVPAAPSRAPGPIDIDADEGEDAESSAVVAQVPLFGPTGVGAVPSDEGKSIPLARVKVSDQSFGDAREPKPAAKRVASTEFGHGRMHLPIVYRLRLDKPGDGLRGERTPTGFDVIIPGRKTMESGAAISRRDDRIAKVVTRNGPEGARVSFRFRGPIPAYKVRLRKDFVEFFISS